MKLLLTRPDGYNQTMMDALNQRNIPYVVTPLMVIQPKACDKLELALATADIVIFVSANAVNCANQFLLMSKWPSNLQYFAIGNATWRACDLLKIHAIVAPDDNQQSEGLLSLPELQNMKGKSIKIIRGAGGRELLALTLTSRGANVDYLEVYQRKRPKLNANQVIADWKALSIDTIVLHSSATLDNLMSLSQKCLNKQLCSWLQTCHIIVPSERTKQLAISLGFSHVTNAQGACLDAMLSALT